MNSDFWIFLTTFVVGLIYSNRRFIVLSIFLKGYLKEGERPFRKFVEKFLEHEPSKNKKHFYVYEVIPFLEQQVRKYHLEGKISDHCFEKIMKKINAKKESLS